MTEAAELSSGGAHPEPSAVIWDWRGEAALDATGPSTGSRRIKGVLQGGVALVAASAFYYFEHLHVALVVACIGSFVVLTALVSPNGLFAAMDRGMSSLGQWIGAALGWVMLTLVFYLFFVPFGLLFRRGRRDSMKRFREEAAASYWAERTSPLPEAGARTRQY